jgi:hypothetical protein
MKLKRFKEILKALWKESIFSDVFTLNLATLKTLREEVKKQRERK